jgi:hypothetical protein
MSRIRLYGETSGYIELKAPDVSNNVVVEFPESALLTQASASAIYAPSASPTFTGTVTAGNILAAIITANNYDIGLTTLNSDSIALNFSAETGLYTRSAAGTITFTASNYRAGAIKTVRIIPGASSRTLNFPANWVFVGSKPPNVAANKTGMLTVTSFGTTEADCVAAWAVQA